MLQPCITPGRGITSPPTRPQVSTSLQLGATNGQRHRFTTKSRRQATTMAARTTVGAWLAASPKGKRRLSRGYPSVRAPLSPSSSLASALSDGSIDAALWASTFLFCVELTRNLRLLRRRQLDPARDLGVAPALSKDRRRWHVFATISSSEPAMIISQMDDDQGSARPTCHCQSNP
jgi:hypothetical protein